MAKKQKKFTLQVVAISALMLTVIGGAFWIGKLTTEVKLLKSGSQVKQQTSPEVQPAAKLDNDQWQRVLKDPAAMKGEKDAPVVMVEFTDYQCPFCRRAFEQTWPQIVKDYIETGKLKYLVRDLPLSIHPNAPGAALAARCAAEQGKYWEMHDKLFSNQDEWAGGKVSGFVKQYAKELGLNSNNFNSCFDEEKYKKEVDADAALANSLGANGTPTFYINGRTLVGAQPIAAFKAVIEEELGK